MNADALSLAQEALEQAQLALSLARQAHAELEDLRLELAVERAFADQARQP